MDLDRDPLGASKDAMREIGYRTVDLLVDQLTDSDIPAMRRGSGDELRKRLMGPAPDIPARGRGSGDDLRKRLMAPASDEPRPWDELLDQLERDVLGPMSQL